MKLFIQYFLLLVLSIALPTLCTAQDSLDWQRYSGNGEEFSALLPEEPSISVISRPINPPEKPKHGRMYGAYSGGTVYVVLSLDNPNKKDAMEIFISEFPQYPVFRAGLNFERDVTLSGFKGKQYRLTLNSVSGIVQFYMTNSHVYIFEVVGEDLSKPSVNQFLQSLKLDGKIKGIDIAKISQNSNITLSAPPLSSSDATTNQSTVENKTYSPKEVTRKAVLVTSPEPQYTEEARKNEIAGTVVLRAVFSSSGKVTNIRAISGLPHGLTEMAIGAARCIKFLPAIKDGKFVSQYIQIEYNFNLY